MARTPLKLSAQRSAVPQDIAHLVRSKDVCSCAGGAAPGSSSESVAQSTSPGS